MSYNHLTLIQENINLNRQGRQNNIPDRKIIPSIHGKNFKQILIEYKNTTILIRKLRKILFSH